MTEIQKLKLRLAKVLDEPVEKIFGDTSNIVPMANIANLPVQDTELPIEADFSSAMWQQIAKAADQQSIISTSDLDGNITHINENFIKVSKYSREELIGTPHSLLRSKHHPDSFFERMWNRIQSGRSWNGSVKNKAKDGSHYWVKTLIMPVFSGDGQIESYVSIRTEITDFVKMASQKKRLELKSKSMRFTNNLYSINRASKNLSEILLEAMEILFEVPWLKAMEKGGVFLANAENEELELAASHQMGPKIDEFCSKVKYGHCLCGRAAASKMPVFASCLDERHEVRFEGMRPHGHYNMPIMVGTELIGVLVVYLTDGAKRHPDEEAFLVDFANALGVIISFKKREEELLVAKQKADESAELANDAMIEAQSAEQAKTNFLATMSHELRTPLNGIIGMLHVVKTSELDEQQQEDIDLAASSADMLLRLINDILDFSKLEYGSMDLEIVPVNVRRQVKESLAPFTFAAEEKGLELLSSVADDFPEYCLGDPTRLRQISTNLVGNAIKFTDQGSITLSTEFCDPPASDTESRKWAITKITDTGIGISKEAQGVIFNRFSQADSTITRKFGGTGLGLSICKQLVESMDGEIGITSEEGKGTTFWYKLPVHMVDKDGKQIKE